MIKGTIKNEKIYICDNDIIHYNHSIPTTIHEIEEDVFFPFVVYESCTNSPILHGVMAPSKDEALQEANDLLIENDDEHGELFFAEQIKF